MTLKEYIDNTGIEPVQSSIRQYDETNFQLYEALDTIGFAGKMGYNDRALLAEWLTQVGLPIKEVKSLISSAIKHPHYSK